MITYPPTVIKFAFLCLSCLLGHYSASSYYLDHYQLKDLYTNDNEFISEQSAWTHTSLSLTATQPYSVCNQTYLLGGYDTLANNYTNGAFYERVYSGLPPHTKIHFTIEIWLIDSWDPNDYVDLKFDDVLLNTFYISAATYGSTNLCGTPSNNDIGKINVYGTVAHSGSSLTFKVIGRNTATSSSESWGFRNINFLFASGSDPFTNKLCGTAPFVLPNLQCPCSEGFSETSPGSCSTCHTNCSLCFGPTQKDCYECKQGYYFTGAECASYESVCTSFSGLNGIFDYDGQCKECQSLKGEYVKTTDLGHQYKLTLSPGACDLTEAMVRKYLKLTPNLHNKFPPFSFQTTKLKQNTYLINLILEESLIEEVDLSVSLNYLQGILHVPKKIVPSQALEQVAKQVDKVQISLSVIIAVSIGSTIALGAAASLWSLISFQQFVGYFRYINVEYPFQTELFFSLSNSVSWDILPNPLDYLTSSLSDEILQQEENFAEEYQPPLKFLKDGYTSFFIENAGTIIAINIGLLLLLFITLLLKSVPYFKDNIILKAAKVNLRWNIISRTFLENGIPLTLGILLQLRTISFDEPYLIICASLTLFSLFYLIGMLVFLTRFVYIRNNDHLKKPLLRKLFGTLYEGMSLDQNGSKYYHLVILFRGLLLIFLIVFLESIPLLQIIPLIIANMFLIYYLFTQTEFVDNKLNLINRIKEVLILIAEILIFLLTFHFNSLAYYEVLGWLIVGSLGVALLIDLGYVIFIQIKGIRELVKSLVRSVKTVKLWFTKKDGNLKTLKVSRIIPESKNSDISLSDTQCDLIK